MKQHIHNGRLLKCVAQEGKCPVSDMHFTTMESYNQFQDKIASCYSRINKIPRDEAKAFFNSLNITLNETDTKNKMKEDFNVDWYARVAKKEGISDPVKLMERITGSKVNEKKVTVEDAKVMREAAKERFNTEIKDYFDKEQLEAMDYEYDNPLFINKDPVKLAKIAEKYRISKDGAIFIYNEITEGRIQGFYGVDEDKLENWDEKTLEKICRSADEVTEIGDLGYMGGLDYDDYYDPDDFIEDLRQEAFVGELSGHRWIGINCDSLNRED
jgi:hypothetical protein